MVARAAQSHIGIARRLARDPQARARRDRVLRDPAHASAGSATRCSRPATSSRCRRTRREAATEHRDAQEKAALLRAMGAEGAATLPPSLRAQVTQLEKDQKRRATRAQRDVLDRSMVDLLSLYRDVLVVQLGAGVELVNAEHEEAVRALAERSTPEQTLRRMDAIGEARTRLAGNVAPLLAVEAMAIALRPQG